MVYDSSAFIFSVNLNKKYPSIKANKNYYRGACGFHFQDITFCDMGKTTGSFDKTGTYHSELELEGKNDTFSIKHFQVYKVEK